MYGLIGMGAAFAGAARAPITAVIVLFELTGEYTIILPLMAAIVIATLASRTLSRDTIYTLKLRRRGVDLDARPEPAVLAGLTVATVVEAATGTTGRTDGRGPPRTRWRCPATGSCRWSARTAAITAV